MTISLRSFLLPLNSFSRFDTLFSTFCNCRATFSFKKMSSLNDAEILKFAIKEQGDYVRKLKEDNAAEVEIMLAVKELNLRKSKLIQIDEKSSSKKQLFDRTKVEDLLKRRFFYAPSFEIYGGVSGLYDYGPMGAALESNIIEFWKKHFVIHDQMLEVRCSQLTPYHVLEASGHVKKFVDLMVRDTVTGDCYRADHLVKACIEKLLSNKKKDDVAKSEYEVILRELDDYGADRLDEIIEKYSIKSNLNNPLTKATEFNLMFSTSIGPTGALKGFLRPETAQGIFVNFKRLLDFNNGKLPFAAAQVGCGFRNEISPRSGLLRVREFTMAEIEHFVNPNDKSHPRFYEVKNIPVKLYSTAMQLSGFEPTEVTLKEAVGSKIISNTTVAYFIGRISMFLLAVGVNPDLLRFRQHLPNEMAHYASECWDAEIKTSYGWIECVGCADRSCYDLKQHTRHTKEKLVAQQELGEPVKVEIYRFVLDKKLVGKTFKKDASAISSVVEQLNKEDVITLENQLLDKGHFSVVVDEKVLTITREMVLNIEKKISDVYVIDVEPHVIEPSFGVGRIMYSLLEHVFRIRPDDLSRQYLAIPSIVAPIKCAILPISKKSEFIPYIDEIIRLCNVCGLSYRKDDYSGSIGRRYARTDEIGIPFIFTIDFDTVKETNLAKATVTIRERDSTTQIRTPIDEAVEIVFDLVNNKQTWDYYTTKYGLFQVSSS